MIVDRRVQLETFKCWSCGCEFAVDQSVSSNKREYKKTLYCPNGCQLSFGKSRTDQVREEMEAEIARVKRDKEYLEASVKRQRERANTAERSLTATRGVVTRIKNRVGKGVCPCCNRTFADLQRHMHAKHPDFATSEA